MKISIGFFIIFVVVELGLGAGTPYSYKHHLVFAREPSSPISKFSLPPKILAKKFLVSVRHKRTHICQGSIVASRLVIVPAHCVKCQSTGAFDTVDLQVFGVRRNNREIFDKPNNVSSVKCVEKNPYDNIAMLWLNHHIDHDYYKILKLPVTNDLDESEKYVAGWGLTGKESKLPETLETSIVPEHECLKVVGELNCQKYFCTLKHKYDICKNDNDAVLVSNNTLIGIATKRGCETNEEYNVFIRLSRYL
ncbi:hypothetical protein HCN44_000272 [Aphidius gifuensis]|uniref:Peptidase S1 domain-containing protein n=1 Tax=Aphidius gifuensis TaxID=684658 RepID=A0A835CNP2_APHGI|nr:hypothetical protein HCN44_000272 [Aphidius gifuensis]